MGIFLFVVAFWRITAPKRVFRGTVEKKWAAQDQPKKREAPNIGVETCEDHSSETCPCKITAFRMASEHITGAEAASLLRELADQPAKKHKNKKQKMSNHERRGGRHHRALQAERRKRNEAEADEYYGGQSVEALLRGSDGDDEYGFDGPALPVWRRPTPRRPNPRPNPNPGHSMDTYACHGLSDQARHPWCDRSA